jgi:hypothetical protein
MPSTRRINAWSSPRNISTALMYAFAQRSDCQVVDEPLYAHYLSNAVQRPLHPGEEVVLATQNPDGEEVVRAVLRGRYGAPVVFFKQMAHHLIQLDESFLFEMDNILLIRDPRAIIASYSKVIPNPTLADVGILKLYELYEKLSPVGKLAAIIDTQELLRDPAAVLRQLCHRLGLPFEPAMLSWSAGPRPEDGAWAPYWYANVHASTGFQPYAERQYDLPPLLEKLAEQCRPYYEVLLREAVKGREGL